MSLTRPISEPPEGLNGLRQPNHLRFAKTCVKPATVQLRPNIPSKPLTKPPTGLST
jgi:hypothetical protein